MFVNRLCVSFLGFSAMAKKKVEVASQSKEEKTVEKDSNRLRELAFSRGLLSEKKDTPEQALRPHAGSGD